MISTTQEDTKTQQQFWIRLSQLQFDLNYYRHYFEYCVNFLRWWKIGTSLLTALATSAWISWGDNPIVKWICAIIIFILQGINAISELLPFENRKKDLREIIILLDPVYGEMERDWFKIADGELSKKQVENRMQHYETRQREIMIHYFKDESLPEIKKITDKAAKDTRLYIETKLF